MIRDYVVNWRVDAERINNRNYRQSEAKGSEELTSGISLVDEHAPPFPEIMSRRLHPNGERWSKQTKPTEFMTIDRIRGIALSLPQTDSWLHLHILSRQENEST